MTYPLDDFDVYYKILYKDHVLELQAAQNWQGNDNYVREHHGTI